jgi:hypothetical protein
MYIIPCVKAICFLLFLLLLRGKLYWFVTFLSHTAILGAANSLSGIVLNPKIEILNRIMKWIIYWEIWKIRVTLRALFTGRSNEFIQTLVKNLRRFWGEFCRLPNVVNIYCCLVVQSIGFPLLYSVCYWFEANCKDRVTLQVTISPSVFVSSSSWGSWPGLSRCANTAFYGTLLPFWQVEELAELVCGHTGCVEVARGGCLFAWNFSMTRSTVLMEVEGRTRPWVSNFYMAKAQTRYCGLIRGPHVEK